MAFPPPPRDTLPDVPPEPEYEEEVAPADDDEQDFTWGYI